MRLAFKFGACFDILLIGLLVAVVGYALATYLQGSAQSDEKAAITKAQMKEACSYEVLQAIRKGSTPDQVSAHLRASKNAREVCAGYEINGVALIPK